MRFEEPYIPNPFVHFVFPYLDFQRPAPDSGFEFDPEILKEFDENGESVPTAVENNRRVERKHLLADVRKLSPVQLRIHLMTSGDIIESLLIALDEAEAAGNIKARPR